MAAVFKSILVAAAVLLVGFGAAGAVWARCFERPPNRWLIDNSKGPKTVETNKFVPDRSPISVEAKLFPPDQAFADHVWVNSTLVQAPKYVDAPNARLVVKPKETEAGIARGRKVVEEIMARIPKSSVETPESDVGGGGGPRPRFSFHLCGPSLEARYPSGNRPTYAPTVGAGKNPLGVTSPSPVSSSGVEPNSVSQPGLKTSTPASSLDGR